MRFDTAGYECIYALELERFQNALYLDFPLQRVCLPAQQPFNLCFVHLHWLFRARCLRHIGRVDESVVMVERKQAGSDRPCHPSPSHVQTRASERRGSSNSNFYVFLPLSFITVRLALVYSFEAAGSAPGSTHPAFTDVSKRAYEIQGFTFAAAMATILDGDT